MQVNIKQERNDDQYSASEGQVANSGQNGHLTTPVARDQNGYPQNNPPLQPPPLIAASQVSVVPNPYAQYAAETGKVAVEQDKDNSTNKQKVPETQIDYPSFKGMFGWTTIDGVNVPYIFRKDRQFVSVRVVEQKLLSRYPNSYPDELGKHQPLTSYFITVHEAKLLNEINIVHCGGEFGQKQFNTKDLIVLLEDFSEFHNLVKKTFPEHIVNAPPQHQINQAMLQDDRSHQLQECGWIQVNNTVTPYVKRAKDKFVPLSVMKYAASLDVPSKGVLPDPAECNLLNKACKEVGFSFTFSKTTKIVSLAEVMKHFPITIINLPSSNPLEYAQYLEIQQTPPSSQVQVPIMNHQPEPSPQQVPNIQQQPNSGPRMNPAYQNYQNAKDMGQQQMPPQMSPDRFPPPPRGPAGGIHPAFMDPRYMFSFNRFPYNMYPVPCGPPNVTVNPMPNGYNGQMSMPPPPYQHNPQMMNGQVRPPRMGSGPQKGPSPSRSSSAGSTGNGPQRSPNTSRSSSSPWHDQNNRPQMSPNRSKQPYPQSPNVPQQYQASNPQQPMNTNQAIMSKPGNGANPMQVNQRSAAVNQNCPQGAQIPTGHPQQRVPITSSSSLPMQNGGVLPNQHIPPPPLMSGPHNGPKGNTANTPPQSQPCPPLMTSGNNVVHPNNRQRQSSGPSGDQNATQNGVKSPAPVVSPVSGVQTGQGKSDVSTIEVPSLTECIKGVWLGGKSISCMHSNGPKRTGKFCLVEAVCKLYFNGCSVNEFLFALENVLKIPLVTCTDEEEKAFIQYYSLPVTVLKCNKMIDFEDLEKFFPQLTYVFRGKFGNTEPHKTLSKNGSSVTSQNKEDKSVSDGGIADQTSIQQRKRANTSPNSGHMNKQPCRRLDEAVRRLHNQRFSENGEPIAENSNATTGGTVIILD